ncbi:MAG: glycosyltransferase family 4 protein [Candidatus Omnitrophica bacterium]|nr:glycosyltransferase family 4 protein [Candidatus Omnitrophota bacterium]
MKILRVLPSMDFGGIERGVYDFSLAATSLGHKVIVVSGPGRFIAPLIEKGIKWYNLPMDKKTPSVFLNSLWTLKKIIEEESPDIIHGESRFPCWVVCTVKNHFPSTPLVTSIHGFYNLRWYSKAAGKGDRVITVSHALKKYAIEYLKVPEHKIRVVYNGVEDAFTEIEKLPSSLIRIGMIARFSGGKGHYCFLKALKRLENEGMKVKGLIVGEGSSRYRKKLEEWITNNTLLETIQIQHLEAKDALKYIDILVVPSTTPEGFGRTVLEAQMSQTVVIGTNIGAVPELVEDGKTGFLFNPGDDKQLAEKIRYIIQNPSSIPLIVKLAYEKAIKNFTVKKMVENTLSVYKELTAK